jgi:DnaJ-class molecular chaperone
VSTDKKGAASGQKTNPGDDAPPGTPGTGEDICPVCGGSGKAENKPCTNCGGTGKVNEGIGGA